MPRTHARSRKQKGLSLDEGICTSTIARMEPQWRPFRKKASRNHVLEAKVAMGGEPYGYPDFHLKATAGQWLCRNPNNSHCWIMSDEGMEQLYDPFDREDKDWKVLIGRLESQKTEKVKTQKPTRKQPSNSKNKLLFS